MRLLFLMIALFIINSCKNDKPAAIVPLAAEEYLKEASTSVTRIDKTMIARLDRLKVRTDSAMNAGTVTVVSERDSFLYLDAISHHRENLKLRGKYYHEPWVKVKHLKTGKQGWVYGGAVRYASEELKTTHNKASTLLQEVMADDLEWDGTCLLYTSPSPRDQRGSRMPSSA